MSKYKSVTKSGIPFQVRDGTVDIDVLNEVVDGDCYRLNQIHLRDRPNIVDVGAHIGGFTKLAAWKWPDAHIYSYEANPRNWDILEKNIQDISDKVVLYKGALVGREPINKRIVIGKAHADHVTGGWGIIFSEENYTPDSNTATEAIENFYSLDNLLPTLDKIDVLKLDCEGSEFSIIDELTTIQLHQVDYILAEIHCGALPHHRISYSEFRRKILNQFLCPGLEARTTVSDNDLFNVIACNKKLIPKKSGDKGKLIAKTRGRR